MHIPDDAPKSEAEYTEWCEKNGIDTQEIGTLENYLDAYIHAQKGFAEVVENSRGQSERPPEFWGAAAVKHRAAKNLSDFLSAFVTGAAMAVNRTMPPPLPEPSDN